MRGLLRSLSSFSLHSLKTIFLLIFIQKEERYEAFREEMKRIDALFLLLVAADRS